MIRIPRIQSIWYTILSAAVLAACNVIVSGGEEPPHQVPPDLQALEGRYYQLPYQGGTIYDVSTGWQPDLVDPFYFGTPGQDGPGIFIYAESSPGIERVAASSVNPGWAANLHAAAVMNEFLRTGVAEFPALRVVLNIHGSVESNYGCLSLAWLDIFNNAWLTPDTIAGPGLLHPSAFSSFSAGAIGPNDGTTDHQFALSAQLAVEFSEFWRGLVRWSSVRVGSDAEPLGDLSLQGR